MSEREITGAIVLEKLITYCGLYEGCCARWHENLTFAKLASAFAELADAHGFHRWMPSGVEEFDYIEFRKGLDFFASKGSWFVCTRGCKGGEGNPHCEIRSCCRGRGLGLCFDCGEFPCDRVKDDAAMIARAEEYRRLGRGKWLCLQVERAKAGYGHHTGKRYRRPLSSSFLRVGTGWT
ncbi:DUF3795 domain-containing protein [Candidatus Bipolaricaulota bacterium]|nr:DUF3795 domain-containing protein [Candidatus Bipolaricaulota bacterium]